jgi:hypothetical protein
VVVSEFVGKDVHQLIRARLIGRTLDFVAVLIASIVDPQKIEQQKPAAGAFVGPLVEATRLSRPKILACLVSGPW